MKTKEKADVYIMNFQSEKNIELGKYPKIMYYLIKYD
jgi:hypothetical protein